MSGGCQVDFYVLESTVQSPEHLACVLSMKAWEQGHCVAVWVENADAAKTLDELMWDSPQGRFLPHSASHADASVPIRIGPDLNVLGNGTDVVINLTTRAVARPEQFRRLLEIVPASAAEKAASRDKFRTYRSRGLELASHTIGT